MDQDINQDLEEKKQTDYLTPPPSAHFLENTDIALPVTRPVVQPLSQEIQNLKDQSLIDEIKPAFLHELQKQKNERFYNFNQQQIPQVQQTNFEKARFFRNKSPILLKSYQELKSHKFEKQFQEAIKEYINKH